MLLIRCPWCGERPQIEFTFKGDASVERPSESASQEEWYDYVYTRTNPRGEYTEWWHHTAGCRHWIKVHRNTLTHEVYSSEPPVHKPREQE